MFAVQKKHLRRDADDERPRAIYRVALDPERSQAPVEAQQPQAQLSANVVVTEVQMLEPRQVLEPLARLQSRFDEASSRRFACVRRGWNTGRRGTTSPHTG